MTYDYHLGYILMMIMTTMTFYVLKQNLHTRVPLAKYIQFSHDHLIKQQREIEIYIILTQ